MALNFEFHRVTHGIKSCLAQTLLTISAAFGREEAFHNAWHLEIAEFISLLFDTFSFKRSIETIKFNVWLAHL